MSDYLFDYVLAHGAIDYARFDTKLLIPSAEEALRRAKLRFEDIINNPDLPTFENTIDALNYHDREFERLSSMYSVMNSSSISEELLNVGKTFEEMQSDQSSDTIASAPLFERIKFLHDNAADLKLTPVQTTAVTAKFRIFSNNGALLSDDDKAVLKNLNKQIAAARTQFQNNVINAVKDFALPIAEEAALDGLPGTSKTNAAAHAKKKGLDAPYALTLDASSYLIAMKNCKNRETRRSLFEGREQATQTAPYDNNLLIMELLGLRQKRAELLGTANHAEHILAERMVNTPEKAKKFIDKLLASAHIAEKQELEAVAAYAHTTDGIEEIQPWDVYYYTQEMQKADKGYNPESVKPYLELNHTLDGVLASYSKLFGIEFRETDSYTKYESQLRVFEIRDNADQAEPTALLYFDLYTREGQKRTGAWVNPTITYHIREDGSTQIPVSSVNANYTRPSDGGPVLLNIVELTTLFHELGHALHMSFGTVPYAKIGSMEVAWDFVEFPSMLLQKWAIEPEVLRSIGRHHETGEPMPEDLIHDIKNNQDTTPGITMKRNAFFAKLDMQLHTTHPDHISSPYEFERNIIDTIGGVALERSMLHRFQHIFAGGYASGYYGYFWADVLAWDAFGKFQENGLYDRNTAQALRDKVLSKGASQDADDLFRSFTGHEPDVNAMLKAMNLPVPEEIEKPAAKILASTPQLQNI